MLAEALQQHREDKASRPRQCIVKEWANSLDKTDSAHFDDAMADYSLSNRELHQVFRKAGAGFSLEALRKHRTEVCPCQA